MSTETCWPRCGQALADAIQEFERATARFRLVASSDARSAATVLETFIARNVLQMPPMRPFVPKAHEECGEAYAAGPAKIDTETVRLAHELADRVSADVTPRRDSWWPPTPWKRFGRGLAPYSPRFTDAGTRGEAAQLNSAAWRLRTLDRPARNELASRANERGQDGPGGPTDAGRDQLAWASSRRERIRLSALAQPRRRSSHRRPLPNRHPQ